MFKKFLLYSSIGTLPILFSCGEKPHETSDGEITTDTLSAAINTDMNLIRVSIPSPNEVTGALTSAGYNYNNSIINPSSKSSAYSTKFQSAVNLGVYGADMGYVGAYNQSQDFLQYVSQVAKLAKTVGVESAFDEEFVKQMNEKIAKNDSTLPSMMDEVFRKAERNLRSRERVGSAALIAAGGWIEGLYLVTSIAGDKAKDSTATVNLYHKIFNQVYSFQYVLDLLEQYKSDPDCAKMMEELAPAKAVLAKYAKVNALNINNITEIKNAITPVRNKITS